ncbi:MAG: hypothetical protein M3069_00720, partial [Chloroflexota bacterium]|nr:hypothetical protein [Chloroflexota bacterium]
ARPAGVHFRTHLTDLVGKDGVRGRRRGAAWQATFEPPLQSGVSRSACPTEAPKPAVATTAPAPASASTGAAQVTTLKLLGWNYEPPLVQENLDRFVQQNPNYKVELAHNDRWPRHRRLL